MDCKFFDRYIDQCFLIICLLLAPACVSDLMEENSMVVLVFSDYITCAITVNAVNTFRQVVVKSLKTLFLKVKGVQARATEFDSRFQDLMTPF